MLAPAELPLDWPQEPDLRLRVVRWRWFASAMQGVLERAAGRDGRMVRLNDDALCQAFFNWVQTLESQQHLEARDSVDFRHAMAGLLLQQLLAAQPSVAGADPLLSLTDAAGNTDQPDRATTLITRVVLGLLQALRLQAGAAAAPLDAALPQYWNSYLENVAQDPALAICYLDQMTGLEPMWNTPTLISERPALRAALAADSIG